MTAKLEEQWEAAVARHKEELERRSEEASHPAGIVERQAEQIRRLRFWVFAMLVGAVLGTVVSIVRAVL